MHNMYIIDKNGGKLFHIRSKQYDFIVDINVSRA